MALNAKHWRALAKIMRHQRPPPKSLQCRHMDWEDLVDAIGKFVFEHTGEKAGFDLEAFIKACKREEKK